MSAQRKRLLIFGDYRAARLRAHERGLGPSDWIHASCRERVMGLDPRQFDTEIVGGTLDAEATAALREWEFRRMVHLGPRGSDQLSGDT